MTDYTFQPLDSSDFVNWDDPTVWAGGVVPNSADADVNFPLVTYLASGQPYTSFVTIQAGETFSVNSIALRDYLIINGALNVAGDLTQYTSGEIDLDGSLSAGSLTNNAYDIQGSGQLTVGNLTNNTHIIGSGAGEASLAVSATTLNNPGTIEASGGTVTVTVPAGGFGNLSAGTLTGGSLISSGSDADLAINAGGVISNDAANITLADGGTITSHDPATGQDVPITTSLTSIAASGSLSLQTGAYTLAPLTVAGSLTVDGASSLTFSQLNVAPGGVLQGSGIIDAPIQNQGTIVAQQPASHGLALSGAITGAGQLDIQDNGDLVLNGATSEGVQFASVSGTLQIGHPGTFSGAIAPTGAGDTIILSGISNASVTGTSYPGGPIGGTLTVQQMGGVTTSLAFTGAYANSSFFLSAGPQLLSSDPPSLEITAGEQPPVCFLAGTAILTPDGERAVETLRPGERVTTWSGEAKVIVWVGSGAAIVGTLDPRPRPVIVRAGALDDGMPYRDLHVTEGHSLMIDDHLIPVSTLINGRSIRWNENARSIAFHHVELEDHDILVANGAPAESYREDGNRLSFDHNDGATSATGKRPCAPIVTDGPVVDRVRLRLAARMGGAKPAYLQSEKSIAEQRMAAR